ncbi:hypothetical protein N0V94_006027 [Neodidymelliopsis sp. IMI 364377]|nr:hypothetical protein N0V94_006027 [Neodidymelliopsis sp. IMI 364377]
MDTGAIIVSVMSLVGAVAAALFTGYLTYAADERKRRHGIRVQVQKYSDPLLISAHDLQERLMELLGGGFGGFEQKNPNGAENLDMFTCYLFAQFLAWTHILKIKAQFLAFSEDKSTSNLRAILYKISDEFSTARYPKNGWEFRLWPGHQLGIAEMMVADEKASDEHVRPLGWNQFKKSYADSEELQKYFIYMRQSIKNVLHAQYKKTEAPDQRIRRLQHFLIDLIIILDPTGQAQADRPFNKCGSATECDCASADCNGTGLAIKRANRSRRDRSAPPINSGKVEEKVQSTS